MALITHDLNKNTQPVKTHTIFNNWDVVAKGFYFAMRSDELPIKKVKSLQLCGQHIVLFRGESGTVFAMDGYCPHMGVDLGIGSVKKDSIQCFFHHWTFAANGECSHIPCGEKPPANAKLHCYTVIEKYGCIFVYPENNVSDEIVGFDELSGFDLMWHHDKSFSRPCHHHISMINGIDPQHLRTVHNINIEMNLEIDERSKETIDITLSGKFPNTRRKERVARWILGDSYAYSMRYAHGTIGALTIMKDVKLFNRFRIPPLHMLYAYRPVEPGRIEVLPIYVNKKRSGILGNIISRFQLLVTRMMYYVLKGEDGDVYDNIRFKTESLLKMDYPIAQYIGFINRLQPSIWSKNYKELKQ